MLTCMLILGHNTQLCDPRDVSFYTAFQKQINMCVKFRQIGVTSRKEFTHLSVCEAFLHICDTDVIGIICRLLRRQCRNKRYQEISELSTTGLA